MSVDHHTNHPVHGTAAGDPYIALPPTAVDATASAPTRLIVAWPGFDPPRTASALAAAIPMTGVPVWRVYLDLPGDSLGGLGSGAILETETIEAYCAGVERAVERLPAALADIRRDLGLPDGPVALAGFSAGGAVALLAAARDVAPVTALALVAPVVAPSRAARAVEKRSGRDRSWTSHATALADRLDLGALAGALAGRDVATLLIGGARDRVVPAREITSLRDLLRRHDTGPVESTTFRMGHALAAEPGTEALPPITEAVRVDAALTDWFRDRLAQPTPPPEGAPPNTQPETASIPDTLQTPNDPPMDTGPLEHLTQAHADAATTGEAQLPDVPTETPRTSPETTQPVDTRQVPDLTDAPQASGIPATGGHGAWSSDRQDTAAPQSTEPQSAAAISGAEHVR